MIITPDSCKGLSDAEIVSRSLENLDYFSCLYQRYEPQLLRYILHLSVSDPEEARDILQESFIKIWRNLNEFDSDLKFSSWVYRIVHNETISFMRKKTSFGKNNRHDIDQLVEFLPQEADPEIDLEEKEVLTRDILERLPMKYREVLILKYYEMKSYEEISDILRIPEGTVAVRLNRARKIFREMIENNS
jgi:RNA polymerase sigma-70 factor (ECF subfamily)